MTSKSLGRGGRQWIESLIDSDSFLPFYPTGHDDQNLHFGDEVISGFAKVNQRPIALYAHNTNISRGYVSSKGAIKISRLMERALALKIPIIALLASPGISIDEGIQSGDEYTHIISQNIALSGLIPQIAVICGPTLGAPAYSAVLMDFTFFNKHRSYLMVTSPAVVHLAIREKTTMSELGGASMHAQVTGIADFVDDSIVAQMNHVKSLIHFLPANGEERPPRMPPAEPLKALPAIPKNLKLAFNMLTLIEAIVDHSTIIEYKRLFGQAMICAFAYINGYPVGILANQSTRLSGAIDSDAAQKSARFLRLCDAYNIPILTLVDVPGFMPGSREEQKGLLRHGANFCAAMQTTVPRVSVIVRKCYGAAAYLLMQSKSQGGDLVLALETAEFGVMGKDASTTVNHIDKSQQEPIENRLPDSADSSLSHVYSLGMIDEVISLSNIRRRLAQHLEYIDRRVGKKQTKNGYFIMP